MDTLYKYREIYDKGIKNQKLQIAEAFKDTWGNLVKLIRT